jgi:plasmid maintenance system killer protein
MRGDARRIPIAQRRVWFASCLPYGATRAVTSATAAHQIWNFAAVTQRMAHRREKPVLDRAGRHSIRVNDQYRICFRWAAHGPKDVELVDYH